MFYLVIIKADSQVINKYENQDSAMSALHSEMAYAYNAHIDTTCMVTDAYGSQIKRERYSAPSPVEENAEQAE